MTRRTPEHLGPATLPNRKCAWGSTAEEQADRQQAVRPICRCCAVDCR